MSNLKNSSSNNTDPIGEKLLLVNDVAGQTRLSISTLNKMRMTGGGPRFVKLGRRVFYRAADVDRWIASNTFRSTGDAA